MRMTAGRREAYAFQATPVRDAFVSFGSLAFAAGSVPGGVASAIRTPEDLAAWPMFTTRPAAGSTWRAGPSEVRGLRAQPAP